MDVDLSRRAAAALSSRLMTEDLSFAKRQAFVDAIEKADNFDDLPEEYQELIEQAESDAQKDENSTAGYDPDASALYGKSRKFNKEAYRNMLKGWKNE